MMRSISSHVLATTLTAMGILLAVAGWLSWPQAAPQALIRGEVARIVAGAQERLEAAAARADRLDPGWRLEQILEEHGHEQLPDESNSAVQLERVLALLPRDWERPESSSELGPAQPDEIPRGERLFRLIEAHDSASRLPDNLIAGLRAELDLVSEAVRAARRLKHYPDGHTRVRYQRNPLKTLLPRVEQSRKVARLLIRDTHRRAAEGEPDGAVESLHALINTGRSIGKEPFLVSQLARGARIGDEAVRAVERVLGHGEPSLESLAALQAVLLREAKFPHQLIALRGERALMVDTCAKLDCGELRLADIAIGLNGTGSAGDYLHPFTFLHNEALFLEILTDDVEMARRPLHTQPTYWEVRSGQREALAAGAGLHANGLYLSLERTSCQLFDFARRVAAKLSCAATAVACERYRRKTGNWPRSLDQLVAGYLDEVPIDPYTGGPIRLAARENGITVYAVGKDRQDDGGRMHPHNTGTEPGFDVGVLLFDPLYRASPDERSS